MKIVFLKAYLALSLIFIIGATLNYFIFDGCLTFIGARQLFAVSAINIMFCYFVVAPHIRLASTMPIGDQDTA